MGNDNQGLDNLDDFTLNVDNVIDNLFSPTKRIEIDPVTNTIKELTPGPASTPQSDKDAAKGPTATKPLAREATPLSEFEPALSSPKQPAFTRPTDQQIEIKIEEITTDNLLKEAFNMANQAMMALDWEANEKNIYSSKETLLKVNDLLDDNKHSSLKELFKLIDKVLSEMLDDLQNIPPTTSKVAFKAFDSIHSLIINGVTDSTELAAATLRPIQDVKNILKILDDAKKQTQKAPATSHENSELSEKLSLDLDYTPKVSVKTESTESVEVVSAKTPAKDTDSKELELIKKQLGQHIEQITKWVELILPVEQLFQDKDTFKKFYIFLSTIRKDMEMQKKVLYSIQTGAVISGLQSQASKLGELANIAKALQSEQKLQEEPVEQCPWDQLVMGETDSGTAAFPASQIVFEGIVPWLSRKKCTGITAFPLKFLKAWPWSDLKSQFKGSLHDLTNQELGNMEFAIARHGEDIKTIAQPYALVLYEHGNGIAALLQGQTTAISNLKDWKWQSLANPQKTGIIGTISREGESIPVFGMLK